MNDSHLGLLLKFQFLKGEVIIGKSGIKGEGSDNRLPPDEFVNVQHILHDLIRGFYKPAGRPYLLSYQATESNSNYGKQIIWNNKDFSMIKMQPPRGEKDKRKISDIEAARYNLKNNIPFGILHKIKKGHNKILGLGKIVSEEENGVFIVIPFEFDASFDQEIKEVENKIEKEINTNLIKEVVLRRGQEKFKSNLLQRSQKCELCNINDKELLIASHIKPWKFSSHLERLDGNNGLLLCPNHDKVFDKGYITFSDRGHLILSTELGSDLKSELKLPPSLSISFNSSTKKYISWHRNHVFDKSRSK